MATLPPPSASPPRRLFAAEDLKLVDDAVWCRRRAPGNMNQIWFRRLHRFRRKLRYGRDFQCAAKNHRGQGDDVLLEKGLKTEPHLFPINIIDTTPLKDVNKYRSLLAGQAQSFDISPKLLYDADCAAPCGASLQLHSVIGCRLQFIDNKYAI